MTKFEKITEYKDDKSLPMPVRKTTGAAGYDFVVAEDTIIPSYFWHMENLKMQETSYIIEGRKETVYDLKDLDDMARMTKKSNAKPTLVPTGMKCYLEPGTYLELSVRSSCPLKYWLVLANSVGIIDADYVDNADNEGHIYFQMINLSPFPILLKKGDIIGQGIIKPYLITDDDAAEGTRTGGFGSTSKWDY